MKLKKEKVKTKKILIIEDEMPLLKALISKFSKEKIETLFAKNGEEGLAVALHDHPDLILLDIIMPRMDGLTMLNILRQDKWGKKVPVILLTNLSDSESINVAKKNKINDYLVKSNWKIGDVISLVKEKINIK